MKHDIKLMGMKVFSPLYSYGEIEWITVKPRGDMMRRLRDGINRKRSAPWSLHGGHRV